MEDDQMRTVAASILELAALFNLGSIVGVFKKGRVKDREVWVSDVVR